MSDRQNTIVCCFDPKIPRITAFQIYDWIHEKLSLEEEDILMIQIDGTRAQVFIKFANGGSMLDVINDTKVQQEYMHDNGELSQVTIEIAEMGMRKIRIANLPPEVSDCMLKANLAKYGEVHAITEEQWIRAYRYKVSNGIQIVEMNLKHHLASHLTIAGNRILVLRGQPAICYVYNTTGNRYDDCPRRKRVAPHNTPPAPTTWADIFSQQERITRITEA